jgi:hypothetical protein
VGTECLFELPVTILVLLEKFRISWLSSLQGIRQSGPFNHWSELLYRRINVEKGFIIFVLVFHPIKNFIIILGGKYIFQHSWCHALEVHWTEHFPVIREQQFLNRETSGSHLINWFSSNEEDSNAFNFIHIANPLTTL